MAKFTRYASALKATFKKYFYVAAGSTDYFWHFQLKKILEVAGGGGHSSKFDDLQESQTRPLSFIEFQ